MSRHQWHFYLPARALYSIGTSCTASPFRRIAIAAVVTRENPGRSAGGHCWPRALRRAGCGVRVLGAGVGQWDPARVRAALAGDAHGDDEIRLGFFEVCRRLLLIPTVKRILTASAVLGMFTVPLNTFFFFFLDETRRDAE